MKPKYRYTSESEIPEALKQFYVKQADNTWIIDIDGAADAAKLREFRDNNITLTKENTDLKKAWEGLDPGEVRQLVEKKADFEASKIKDKSEFEKQMQERVNAMKTAHEAETKKLNDELAARRNRIAALTIDSALVERGLSAGLRETAQQDLILRGRNVFQLDDHDNVVAMKDGKPWYDDKGDPMTIDNWITNTLHKEAEHLFHPNQGGGSKGGKSNNGNQGFQGKNPFAADSLNITEQGKLMKSDRPLAQRLATEAGVRIPGLNS